jgi:hypothetical protein
MNEPDPADLEMQELPLADILADIAWQAGDEDAEPDGPGFPDGFQGAGPMYAAVPLGREWLKTADSGATTYVLENPLGWDPQMSDGQIQDGRDAYTGWSAFLDRGQAEQLADHPARHGEFTRWEGLNGHNDWTAAMEARFAQADAETTGFLGSLPEAGS